MSEPSSQKAGELDAPLPKKGVAQWLKEIENPLLRVGGIIGAIFAIATVPAATYGVWKSWNEGIDRLSKPAVSATAPNFSIRCAISKPAGVELILQEHCVHKDLGVSALLRFENKDMVPRSIVKLTAVLTAVGVDGNEEWFFNRPRFIRFEERNGVQEVVFSSWTSIELPPSANATQEILLTQQKKDAHTYLEFIQYMYGKLGSNKWHSAKLKIEAEFQTGDKIQIFSCEDKFSKDALSARQGSTTKHYKEWKQIPVNCIAINEADEIS